MNPRAQLGFAMFAATTLLVAACGSSKPFQEEPNAPTGASPTAPGPLTSTDPSPVPNPIATTPTPGVPPPKTDPPNGAGPAQPESAGPAK